MKIRLLPLSAVALALTLAAGAAVQPRPALPPPGGAFADAGGATAASGPSAPIQELVGDKLVNAEGQEVPLTALGGKKAIGLYFSASWCGPCHAFTPALVKAYKKAREAGLPIEIILVSADQSAGAMKKYMREMGMPWPAIPFDGPKRDQVSAKYQVSGIPTLIIVDANGVTLDTNGRGAIIADGAKAFEKWAK